MRPAHSADGIRRLRRTLPSSQPLLPIATATTASMAAVACLSGHTGDPRALALGVAVIAGARVNRNALTSAVHEKSHGQENKALGSRIGRAQRPR